VVVRPRDQLAAGNPGDEQERNVASPQDDHLLRAAVLE
jgi:hypothetical protein